MVDPLLHVLSQLPIYEVGNCLSAATELSCMLPFDNSVVIGYFDQNGYTVEKCGEFHCWVEYKISNDIFILDPILRLHDKKLNLNYVEFSDIEEYGMLIEPNIYSYMKREKEKFFFSKRINGVQHSKEFSTAMEAINYKLNFLSVNKVKTDKQDEFTAKRMKELVVYSPDTGDFISKVNGYGKIKGESCVKTSLDGYKYLSLDNMKKHAHIFAWLYMTGKWPDKLINHIDTDPSNTKWVNLRESSNSHTGFNTKNRTNNTSSVKGVVRNRTDSSWVAQIKINGKPIYLGSFSIFKNAVKARYNAEVEFDVPIDNSPAYMYLKKNNLI